MPKKKKPSKRQNEIARQMILRTGNHAGPHKNTKKRELQVPRKRKHTNREDLDKG